MRMPLSMAFRIFCDPDSTPIHTSAQPARRRANGFFLHEINTRLNFEWDGSIEAADQVGQLSDPLTLQAENVIGKPEMFRTIEFLQEGHFLDHTLRRTHVECIAIDRLGTPITSKGTPPARCNIEREEAMCGFPS